jgi:hypothetical protein
MESTPTARSKINGIRQEWPCTALTVILTSAALPNELRLIRDRSSGDSESIRETESENSKEFGESKEHQPTNPPRYFENAGASPAFPSVTIGATECNY